MSTEPIDLQMSALALTPSGGVRQAAAGPQLINPTTLARLWVEDWRAPICSPLRDMIRSDDCDSDLNPTMAAFERIAAELKALAEAH